MMATVKRANHSAAHTRLVRAIEQLAELKGWFAWPMKTTGTYDPATKRFRKFHGRKGVADVAILHRGTFYAVEAKTGKGVLSPDQKEFRRRTVAAGGVYVECRNLDDVMDAIQGEQG